MEAAMKISWLKYLFASMLVGIPVGLYQMLVHKTSEDSSLSQFQELQDQQMQDQQIGNFGFSEINRAARIAQKEQQSLQDVDVEIPVNFEASET